MDIMLSHKNEVDENSKSSNSVNINNNNNNSNKSNKEISTGELELLAKLEEANR